MAVSGELRMCCERESVQHACALNRISENGKVHHVITSAEIIILIASITIKTIYLLELFSLKG